MGKTSYITGRAMVVFGGSINFGIGYNPNNKLVGLNLSELTNQFQVGEKLNGDEEQNEPQVILIFGCVESINVFRRVLDIAERTLKDGKIPSLEGGEK